MGAYNGRLDPGTFRSGTKTLYALGDYGITPGSGSFSLLPATLKSTIEEYFAAQFAQVATAERESHTFYQQNDSQAPSTMKDFIAALSKALQSGPVYLSLGGRLPNGRSGGHAVVAMRVDQPAGGTGGEIEIYDNNIPGTICYVNYSLAGTGSWSYPALFASSTRISWVAPATVQGLVDAAAGTLTYDASWVETSANGSIAFTATDGATTGKVNGAYVEANAAVRLDPVMDGAQAPRAEDRYAVQGEADRAFTLSSGQATATWATGRGPAGGYAVTVDGTATLTAAYAGDAVSFSQAKGTGLRLAVENGATLGEAVFTPTGGSGQGTVRLQGPSGVEVQPGTSTVDEIILGDATTLVAVKNIPTAAAIRADLSGYDAKAGTLVLTLDENGDGTFETSKTLPTAALRRT